MKGRTKAGILMAAILVLVLGLHTAAMAQEATASYTHEEAFSQAHTLEGMFSSFTEYFNTGEWDIQSAQLSLVYATTPLVIEKVSDLTLYINGRPFYSERVQPTSGAITQLKVDLPVDAIKEGLNSIEVFAYIRTHEDDPCTDDASQMGWMDINVESSVSVAYTPNAQTETIADFYRNFSSIDTLENRQSVVVIPRDATQTELTLAGLALSGMANNAVLFYDNVQLETLDATGSLPSGPYILYIAESSRLAADVSASLDETQRKDAENGALLALVSPAEGQHMLVITGADTQALLNAGRVLGNASYMEQFIMASRAMTAGEDVSMPAGTALQDDAIALTATGEYLHGVFRRSHTFYVENDPGRVFAPGSQVELSYRYSDNLDFDRSMVTVYVDGTPIGSRQLTASGSNGSELILVIPDTLDVQGNFTVEVAFDLELEDIWCTQRAEEMPWAYITPESTLNAVWKKTDKLLFDYYPSPFIQDGLMNNVVIVLPDAPSGIDLDAFREISLSLGRYLRDNRGSLQVLHMSEAGSLSGQNTILIGHIAENPLAAAQNSAMYFRFSDDQTTLLSNEKMLIDPAYGARLGTAQLLDAGNGNATLVLTAVRDEEVAYAASYLGDTAKIDALSGDAYIASSTGIQSFKFKMDNDKTPSLYDQLLAQKDMMRLVLIGGGVALILAVAAVLMIVKYRRRGN